MKTVVLRFSVSTPSVYSLLVPLRSWITVSQHIGNLVLTGKSSVSGILSSQTSGAFLGVGIQQVRYNVRNHFPRPSEYRRVKRHGYKTRLSTAAGRRIIMRRILKGRHVLTH
ncbi:mitochondrial ribosomal protein L34 isoform X2 [Tachypleus tridentatus]|uniref:mitochondrial ribosomal protein L34 isoform X2 n=1 Tax=Tachypleus tridentatus TaxID=6853 RepID=UPI003FD2DDF7